MNTSERICYLKDNSLFLVINGTTRPVSPEEVVSGKEKMTLIIDDGYFFYVGMDNISVTGKKLRSIAGNYLNVLFPGDMIKNYGVYQGKGFTMIFVISDELSEIIKSNGELFAAAKKITTSFIELSARYEDFIFSDGRKLYKKSGATITAAAPEEHGITVSDLFSEIERPRTSIHLPGVSVSHFSKTPYILPAAILIVCYALFFAGNIVSLNATSKTAAYYEEKLQNVYKSVGIDTSSDPYGALLYKAGKTNKSTGGKRVLETISDLKSIVGSGTELKSLNIRDKAIRVDGVADDFAKVEYIKKTAEEKLRTFVSMDDTKKTDKGIAFVMRYEQ